MLFRSSLRAPWPRGGLLSSPEFDFFLARDACGQGYGAAAVRARQVRAVELGFSTLAGFIVEENAASRRLAEKCGFTLEGILHFPHIKPGLCLYGWRA